MELPEAQKSIKITYDGKGVRLDVYVEDKENTVYDLEMQATDMKNLPKRSRYYQGMIDLNLISKGENYKKLKKRFEIDNSYIKKGNGTAYRYVVQSRVRRRRMKLWEE